MSMTVVIDTVILGLACPEDKDFSPEAVNLIWSILTICYKIAIDHDSFIMEREYNIWRRKSRSLSSWIKMMNKKRKIKHCNGIGYKIKGLTEMDNRFACVTINTEDKILITENFRCFNEDVRRRLRRYGVEVINLKKGYDLICNRKPIDIIRRSKKKRKRKN